ncbi:MAG: enoyl-CoA hydratase/isomerase family protein [Acidimicrobiales bacterium]
MLTKPDGSLPYNSAGEDRTADLLSSYPCIVVAVERQPGVFPELADVGVEGGGALDDILVAVDRNPVAATSLVMCLRQAPLSPERGLIAESSTYSLLQSGDEYQKWLAARPVRATRSEFGPAVRIERRDDRLDLVLNRPSVRNALNKTMRDELLEGLAVAAADSSITQVVLRGEGESFCSGGDLDEFGTFTDPASAHLVRLTTSIGRAIRSLGSRLVVRAHGSCSGSGVELPAFADRFEIRSDFVAKLPEVSMGLIPGAGGTVSITRRIGRHRMALLAITGTTIDATTAVAWGLADGIIPA